MTKITMKAVIIRETTASWWSRWGWRRGTYKTI